MDQRQYSELLSAIIDLRSATELGFTNVNRRFDETEERWDRRFNELEDSWGRRFSALETRVEDGFRSVGASLDDIRNRLATVER